MPFGLVMTLLLAPDVETATKRDNSGAHVTDVQLVSVAADREVQVMPSGLVMTRLPVPETDVATKSDKLEAHVNPHHSLSVADVLDVQR